MARLPDVTDFGARPSYRSNRLDPVQPEGLEVAEAVTRAAQVFASIYAENKEKDSRLNYALIKNEAMALDVRLRSSFDERQDYEAFDESYQNDLAAGLNELLERRGSLLTPKDLALFQAEMDLMRERGRVVVGERAESLRIQMQAVEVGNQLMAARDQLNVVNDQETRNEIIGQTLETLNAAGEDQIMPWPEVRAQQMQFVTDAATDAINDIKDPQERLEEIRYALAWRERNGGQLTPEQAAAGEGSNSMGDYLPVHVLEEMERVAEKEVELEGIAEIGQSVSDAAFVAHPGLQDGKARETFVRNHPDVQGNPEARNEAMQLVRARGESDRVSTNAANTEYFRMLYSAIQDDPMTQVDPNTMAMLPPRTQENLRDAQRRARENIEWRGEQGDPNGFDKWGAYDHFMGLSVQEMAEWDPDGSWQDADGVEWTWRQSITRARAEQFREMSRQARVALESGEDGGLHTGLTQEQHLERALVASPFFTEKPTASSSEDDRERWMRISLEVDRQLREISRSGVEINPDHIDSVINKVLGTLVTNTEGWNEDLPFAALNPEDYDETYIPIDRAVPMGNMMVTIQTPTIIPNMAGNVPIGGDDFTPQSPYIFIRNQLAAANGGAEPKQRDIEEVWFYVVTQGWAAARNRWLGLEGY